MPKKPQATKRWFVFCEPCSYKQIVAAEEPIPDNLTEIKTVSVPGGSPYIDPETKKTKTKPSQPRLKMVKCPKCGRGVVVKKLPDVYANAYKAIDDEKLKREQEIEKQKRIEDGKPHKREKDEEFMG